MLVTIVISTWNRKHLLPEAIDSILNQTHQDIELIIVDDNSQDKTKELILSYKDPRIKYYRNFSRKGVVYSLSKAFNRAQGKYIGVVDSDDYLELTAVEECLNNIGDAGMIYTQARYFGFKTGKVKIGNLPYSYDNLLKQFMTFNFRLFKAELWQQIKPLSDVNHCEDYDLSLRISEAAEIVHLPKILYNYRIHEGNKSQNRKELVCDRELCKQYAIARRSKQTAKTSK